MSASIKYEALAETDSSRTSMGRRWEISSCMRERRSRKPCVASRSSRKRRSRERVPSSSSSSSVIRRAESCATADVPIDAAQAAANSYSSGVNSMFGRERIKHCPNGGRGTCMKARESTNERRTLADGPPITLGNSSLVTVEPGQVTRSSIVSPRRTATRSAPKASPRDLVATPVSGPPATSPNAFAKSLRSPKVRFEPLARGAGVRFTSHHRPTSALFEGDRLDTPTTVTIVAIVDTGAI